MAPRAMRAVTVVALGVAVALAAVAGVVVASGGSSGLGRGFGDHYPWVSFTEGLEQLREGAGAKPGMIVFHKSWCGACKALGPKFAASQEIRALADRFVMINVQDDDDPNDPLYTVDGGYIPRIYFVDADGKPLPQFTSQNPQYRHFFGSPEEIAATMAAVLNPDKAGAASDSAADPHAKTEV